MIKPSFALPVAFLLAAAPLVAQVNPLDSSIPLQAGFVLVTPTSGSGTGIFASETIGNLQSSGFQTAVIPAAPLTTSASVLVNVSNDVNSFTGPIIGTTQVSTDAANIAGTNPGYSPGIGGGRTALPIQQTGPNPPSQSNVSTNTSATSSSTAQFAAPSPDPSNPFNNTAIAVVNPNPTPATVAVTLSTTQGSIHLPDLTIGPMQQISDFVTQLLGGSAALTLPVTGVLNLDSDVPIAVAALQFRGITFLTLPVTTPLPAAVGNGTFVLPQFVVGGGWTTQLLIGNVSSLTQPVRVDVFSNSGTALSTTLNAQTGATFANLQVLSGNVISLAPQDVNGQTLF